MKCKKNPLAEVFGYQTSDSSNAANRYRNNRLCPYNNKVPNCTKDKAKNPLGVCSIHHDEGIAITCPIRFREDWIITDDAAGFFFPAGTAWSSLTEVRLHESNGKSAGNIDIVLVAYDENGKVTDFGGLEIQGVYISGNIREPFAHFMADPQSRGDMDWRGQPNYPRPDYLSSSRKRLAPQLLFKGGIFKSWNKKTAVAIHQGFFATLPRLTPTNPQDADIAWFIYDLEEYQTGDGVRYRLVKKDTIYTRFESALLSITTPSPGNIQEFINLLQDKLDDQLEAAPVTSTIESPF